MTSGGILKDSGQRDVSYCFLELSTLSNSCLYVEKKFFFAAVILSKQFTVNNFYQNSLFLLIEQI